MIEAQVYIDRFMQSLAGEAVDLNPQLKQIFTRILSRQITINEANQVEKSSTFDSLLKVFTYVSTSDPGARPDGGPFAYTEFEKAKISAQEAVDSLSPQDENEDPITNSDSATVFAGESVAVDVLANDNDPDGDPLTITSVTQGDHGSVEVINNGLELRYLANDNYSGTDRFEYTVNDGHGNEATETVDITVVALTELTLAEALALETLPERYLLDATETVANQNLSVAEAAERLSTVTNLIAGAENADALSLSALFQWSVLDSAALLLAAIATTVPLHIAGADMLRVTDEELAQADLNALNALENFKADGSSDFISESPTEDSSGYDSHYNNINDVLLLPDAKIGVVAPDAPTDAYLHISAGESGKFDHDTFLLEFDASADYRIAITPENPNLFQSNKVIWLWKEDGSYSDLIMNQTDGFVDGVLYSDIFSAESGDSKYISVSLRWDGGYGEVATGPAPYRIELLAKEPSSFNLISESPTKDTSGYDSSYGNINDVLFLPDAKIGVVTPDAPTDAYLHISAGESGKFDHDTFLLQFDASADYRLAITPEDPNLFQSNKSVWLWNEDGSYDGLIMNQTDGFVDGVLYSEIFSAEEGDSKYISVSLRWDGGFGEVATGPAPYEIELVGVA